MAFRGRALFALVVLFAINLLNFFDRNIGGALNEPIKDEFKLTDGQMGFLAMGFTLLYAAVGVPLGRWADKGNRTHLLSGGVFLWSLMTAASGMAWNYSSLFLIRLGIGVGEATCAPASSSLIGDLFPPAARARALSLFMMGLPVGTALSFTISGILAQNFGWRMAFFVAGVPGLLCAAAVLFIKEPVRGASEQHNVGATKRDGSPFKLVLATPTMLWIILSGALHNFNMYTIGIFLSAYLMRFHGLTLVNASLITAVVFGLSGIPGLLFGGFSGDWALKRRVNGRLLVGMGALAVSAPLAFFALRCSAGEVAMFSILMGIGIGSMYVYYSTVYSTIQDVIEPSLRATAMALYFFAMYTLGGSLGPVLTGAASDYFREAAVAAGSSDEQAKALGLRSAMFIIPAVNAILAVILFAASRTVGKDVERLQVWMRATAKTRDAAQPGLAAADA